MRKPRGMISGLILGLGVGTMLAVVPTAAQAFDTSSPVCLRVYQGFEDFYDECGYTSMAQCRATASGRSAQCLENPFYAPRQPYRRAPRRHHSAH